MKNSISNIIATKSFLYIFVIAIIWESWKGISWFLNQPNDFLFIIGGLLTAIMIGMIGFFIEREWNFYFPKTDSYNKKFDLSKMTEDIWLPIRDTNVPTINEENPIVNKNTEFKCNCPKCEIDRQNNELKWDVDNDGPIG